MTKQTAESLRHYITFIDVVYAVLVGETIFEYGKELFDPAAISTFAMITVYISIISSWLFWHTAISKYPHKNPSRFFVDIIVLITYLLIMFEHSNLDTVFLGFIVIYLLFFIWDFLTRIEYNKEAGRLRSSSTNLLLVSSIAVARHVLVDRIEICSTVLNYIFLAVLIGLIVVSQAKDILRVSCNS